jgi:hypothetical protein
MHYTGSLEWYSIPAFPAVNTSAVTALILAWHTDVNTAGTPFDFTIGAGQGTVHAKLLIFMEIC